ncbi:MAG: leucine-rich repeat domain-containing protein [Clostridia bacterium]|nr:leucine-rich repeat domain-containing protein [Clostridia bacterium]
MKKFLAVTLAALMALSMVACTGTQDGGDNIGDYTPEQSEYITDKGTFTFAEGAADTAVLVSYVGKATHNDKVTVPAVFNGRPVAAIGEKAFYQLASVVSVQLPATVTVIDDYAFSGCVNLSEITWKDEETGKTSTGNALPEGLETIGECAFYGCTAITELDLGKSLEVIDNFAFADCSELTEAKLPSTTQTVGDGAFWQCHALTEFNSNQVKKIGTLALYDCTAIEKITLSNAIEEIGEFAFATESSTLKDKIDTDSFKDNDYVKKYYENIADAVTTDDGETTAGEEETTTADTTEAETTEPESEDVTTEAATTAA